MKHLKRVVIDFDKVVADYFEIKDTEITSDDVRLILQAMKNWSQVTSNEKEKERLEQLIILLEAMAFGVGADCITWEYLEQEKEGQG